MKNRLNWLALPAVLALLVASCTHAPMIKHHSITYQHKVEAAEHWARLAAQLAGGLTQQTNLAGKSLHVANATEAPTEFERAYWKLVRMELLRRGWKLMDKPEDAELAVIIETQLIKHGARWFGMNTTSVWSSIGYSVLHFFSGDGGEGLNSDYETSRDLLITTVVREQGLPVQGVTQLVYVPPADALLYGDIHASDQPRGWAKYMEWAHQD